MAAGPITQAVSDIIVPEIFTPYVQQLTEEKARIVQSGVLSRDGLLDQLLAGGGLTFNLPSQTDLDNDADNVSGDGPADIMVASFENGTPTDANRLDSTPLKVGSDQEIAVRLSRNNSWSSADLTRALAGMDPMQGIGMRVAFYWARRLQAAFIATMNGVIKDNDANDSDDYMNDISAAGSFTDGVTNFSAEALLDAAVTMGDSMESLVMLMVHSIVYNRMQKNNLIDFIPDARGEVTIPTFLGREVVVDDGMPNAAGVFDSWLFGRDAVAFGVGTPKVPTEVWRQPQAGNGGGQEVLSSRVEWSIHPRGHAYIGTAPKGGPGNGTGTNQLNVATSWNRVYPERKMVKFARLITTEF